MFYIDDFNKEEFTFELAKKIVLGGKKNITLLDAITELEERLMVERNEADLEDNMSDFYYNWSYEINAYNKVVQEMSKLFK